MYTAYCSYCLLDKPTEDESASCELCEVLRWTLYLPTSRVTCHIQHSVLLYHLWQQPRRLVDICCVAILYCLFSCLLLLVKYDDDNYTSCTSIFLQVMFFFFRGGREGGAVRKGFLVNWEFMALTIILKVSECSLQALQALQGIRAVSPLNNHLLKWLLVCHLTLRGSCFNLKRKIEI